MRQNTGKKRKYENVEKQSFDKEGNTKTLDTLVSFIDTLALYDRNVAGTLLFSQDPVQNPCLTMWPMSRKTVSTRP